MAFANEIETLRFFFSLIFLLPQLSHSLSLSSFGLSFLLFCLISPIGPIRIRRHEASQKIKKNGNKIKALTSNTPFFALYGN